MFGIRTLSSTLASAASLAAASAFAQDATPATILAATDTAPPVPDGGQVDGGEVVVTAQKRTENVQQVPATVTAIGGERLERYAIDSAADVGRFAPNVNGWNNDGRSRPRYFIRGIGNGNVANNAVGAVSLYNDEVYLNSLVLQGFPLLDLERVEVLSGPQGTLQGKNATAGSINFISRRPSFETSGYAKVSAGDYGQKQLETAGGGAITDNLAFRVAARVERQGGLAENRATGNDVGDFTDVAARFELLARLGDDTEVLANVHYRNLRSTRTPYYAAIQAQRAPLAQVDRNYDDTSIDGPQNIDASGALLRIDSDLGRSLKLTSITGYDEGDRLELSDTDYSTRELGRGYSRTRPDQITEELRLSSPQTDRLSWILGGYYFHERLRSFAASATINNSSGGTPSYYYTSFTQKTDSYAGFASLRFDVTRKLHLQGGLRWTKDTSHIDLVSQRAVPPVTFVTPDTFWQPSSTGQTLVDIARQDQSADWSKLTYDASARWDVTSRINLYARIANGYRAGNFQGQVTPTTPPGTVDPETLTAYEAGIKTEWFDGKLTFNLDGFYSDYKDIQISVVQPSATGIIAQLANAGAGYSKGVEAELRAKPTSRLSITGNLGLLRTRFTSFTITNATANIDGAEFARAPHTTAFMAAHYNLPLGGGNGLTFSTDWRYNSHFYFIVTDETSPALQQNGYAVGNARVSFHTSGDRLELTAGVYNLANQRYLVQVLPYTFGSYGYALGAPRMFLASIRTAF